MLSRRVARAVFSLSVIVSTILIGLSLNADMWLPPYDHCNFGDNFDGSTINEAFWTFEGNGRYSLKNSILTVGSQPAGSAAIRHSFVRISEFEVCRGSVEISLRFDGFANGSTLLIMTRIDGGWIGVSGSEFVYFDEGLNGTGTGPRTLQFGLDSNWHTLRMIYDKNGRRVFWDDRLQFAAPDVQQFTFIRLGHTDPREDAGGLASFDRISLVSIRE